MGTLNFAGGASLSGSGSNLQTTSGLDFGGSWVDAPPGTVIQTVYATTTTEEANSNSSYITWFSKQWTPRSSTSHKIITVCAIRLVVGTNLEANFRISDGSSETPRYRLYNDNVSGNFWYNPVLTWYWPRTHTAGQPVTFSAQCRDGNNSSSNVIWGDNGSTSTMIIQEIAQ